MFWCEQGKQPLFKLWDSKSSKAKKKLDVGDQKLSEKKLHVGDEKLDVGDEKQPVDVTTGATSSLKETKDTVYVTELSNLLPEHECGSLGNKTVLRDSNDRCSCLNTQRPHSFTKPSSKKSTDLSHLESVAESADNLSQMNSRLSYPGGIAEGERCYSWSSTVTDSLCETLSQEGHDSSSYWAHALSRDLKQTYREHYEYSIQNTGVRTHSRTNISHSDMYTSLLKQGGECTKYFVSRRPYHADMLPWVKKICQLEDAKLSTMHERKRGNRRYMHYLKTAGIHLEDDVLTRLSQAFL